jgi:hypothetical protein
MDKGRYDLAGAVLAVAVKDVSPRSVTLLVVAQSQQVGATGSRATTVRYEVTVVATGGTWAASRIQIRTAQ